MTSSKLDLEVCVPVTARGLTRGAIPGVGVRVGRRAATADLWIDRSGEPVVRFRTARIAHWFRVTRSAKGAWSAVSSTEWDDFLAEHLLEWLGDSMDGEFD